LGTDLVSAASSHREMQLLCQAGLSPLEVIRIATFNAAVFLGRDRDLGSIAPGKIADLVLLNRDPTADIDATEDIAMVIHNGLVVDRAALPVAGTKELLRRDVRANQVVNPKHPPKHSDRAAEMGG